MRILSTVLLLLLGSLMTDSVLAKDLPDFDKLWNYGKPEETETKFRALLNEAEKSGNKDYHLQLLTQIARTFSLRAKFDEAHKVLDEVKSQLNEATKVAELRYLLERGRTFNSAKRIAEAIPLFAEAYELSLERKQDFYAVDAAHMLAIAEKDPAKQMEWNLKAVGLAEKSKDEKAKGWLGSLYNNIGWTYHDTGMFENALGIFEKALEFRQKKGQAAETRVAKWSVGRALRSLKKHDEALKIQRTLEKEFDSLPEKDGFVFEELGELLLLTDKEEEAKKYFGLAYDELVKDTWLAENEPKRLGRLKELGGGQVGS